MPTDDPQNINTVTDDKTPTATHTSKRYDDIGAKCGKCGSPISILETCWIVGGLVYCDTDTCKPRKLNRS